LNEITTKSKVIDPVIEEQEEQQFSDGPSIFTNPAFSPATDIGFG